MIIDIHSHFIPGFAVDEARLGMSALDMQFEDGELIHPGGMSYPLTSTFIDPEARIRELDALRVDAAVTTLAPTMFGYDLPSEAAATFASRANDALSEYVGGSDRLIGLAALPMQDPAAAVAELERAVSALGLRGAQVGTHPCGSPLDDPVYEPVLAAAERLGVVIMVHPHFSGPKPGIEPYYLTNTIGNPVDTTVVAARLIHSGVLDRLPSLRLILVHGGGFLPYQLGRLDRAWDQRAEPRAAQASRPSSYLARFWIDTVTHGDRALSFLHDMIGDDRLVLGTDLPFDMADPDPVARVDRLGLDGDVMGKAAVAALGGAWL